MAPRAPDTAELLNRVNSGDDAAREQLFARHRSRLRQMVAVRMDPRLGGRLDPSDVVQETLAQAARLLPDYLRKRPLPFYPWLRQIAWERLVHLHARHVAAQRRSVRREEDHDLRLSDQSAWALADRFVSLTASPSQRALKEELRRRVREAIDRLSPPHREVIVLRHLEQLPFEQVAAVLGVSEAAAESRYRRAVEKLHGLLLDHDLRDTP